jgi:hypothetical protein
MKKNAVVSAVPQPAPIPAGSPAEPDRCLFADARGHQCRMFRMETHRSLCPFHAHQEQQILDAGSVAKELASISGHFRTANDINHALGKLFKLCAADRLPARKAAVLAYIGQLLLHSLSGVRNEYELGNGLDAWDRLVYDTVGKGFPVPAPGDPVPLGQSYAVARALRVMAQRLASKSASRAPGSSVTNDRSPVNPSSTTPSAGAVG